MLTYNVVYITPMSVGWLSVAKKQKNNIETHFTRNINKLQIKGIIVIGHVPTCTLIFTTTVIVALSCLVYCEKLDIITSYRVMNKPLESEAYDQPKPEVSNLSI